jgi:hypothetical protein
MADESLFDDARPRKGRGKSPKSLALIEAMHDIAAAAQPITGRGVGYKLFVAGLIESMSRNEMQKVYRLLKEAREEGVIPWDWIVDESRSLERVPRWDDPEDFARTVAGAYRRDFWVQQPHRVQVWSEKGTVRGVLKPVLDEYAVDFLPVHGFSSATQAWDTAQDDDGRPLHVLYVGDYDPSGMYMSNVDLPERFERYGGDHIRLQRIALRFAHVHSLPSFAATDKRKDPRFDWFVSNYGSNCWELDAMDPNDLRDCVETAVKALIEPDAWARCDAVNRAEQESLKSILNGWHA